MLANAVVLAANYRDNEVGPGAETPLPAGSTFTPSVGSAFVAPLSLTTCVLLATIAVLVASWCYLLRNGRRGRVTRQPRVRATAMKGSCRQT